ncbi:tyrosine-type recombinase/integrase [Nocardioides korecus]
MPRTEPIRKEASGRYVVVLDTAAPGESRRQTKRRFTTYREARAWLTDARQQVNDHRFVPSQRITVGEWLEQWLNGLRLAPSTVASYRKNVRLHLAPRIGSVPLQQLTGSQLSALYRELETSGRRDHRSGGLSPRTVRYVHTILKAALREAIDQGLRIDNPADRAKPPSVSAARAPEMLVWDAGHLAAFLGWARSTERVDAASWHLLAFTGMRRGELLALRWRDLDLDAHRLSIRRSVGVIRVEDQGKQLVEGPTKGKRARVVDLDAGTTRVLRRWRTVRAQHQLQFVGEDALIFGRLEDPWRHQHPERYSARFVEAQAKFRASSDSTVPRPIHLHDLRHTHASLLLKAGVPVKVVSERLGHATVMITLETYAHVLPGMQAEAAAAFASAVQLDT